MVNYFNLLDDDEDVEQQPQQQKQEQQVPVATPILTSFPKQEKTPQHIEIHFDFNDHDLEKTFTENWVLYFDTKKNKETTTTNEPHPDENSKYLENIQKVGSFNTLKGFKECWESLSSPLDVSHGNISIFKEGIEPAWEDIKNKNGGKYSINYLKDNNDFSKILNAWFTLLTTIVYSSWEHYDQSNGIVLSIRSWGGSINLWNTNCEIQDKVQSLKESFQTILQVKNSKYSSHKTSINSKSNKKQDDFNNKKKKTNKFTDYGWNTFDNNSNNNNNNNNNKQWNNQSNNIKKKEEKKENSLSVSTVPLVQIHTPVQLPSTTTGTSLSRSNSETSLASLNAATPVVDVPEVPSGVNAWSTGLLLGTTPNDNPTATTTEVEEGEIVVNNNNKQTAVVDDEIEEGEIVEPKVTVVKQPEIVIPSGVNAWSTGILCPKPVPAPVIEEPVVVPSVVESVWSSNKLTQDDTTSNTKSEKKEKKEKKVVIEKVEKKEKKEKKEPKQQQEEKSNMKRVNSKETLKPVESSLWEEPESAVPATTTTPAVVKVESKKKNTGAWENNEVKKEVSSAATTANAVIAKSTNNKPNKQQNSKKTASSSWSSPQSIVELIETISQQPESSIVETSTTTTSTTTVVQDNNTLSITTEQKETKVQKLAIKETKKLEVIEKVEIKDEWKSVEEKKPKTSKPKEETTSKPIPTGPQDNLLIRNLLVEEPLDYPSPVKPIKKNIQSNNNNNNNNNTSSTSTTTTTTTKTISSAASDKSTKESKPNKKPNSNKQSKSSKSTTTTSAPKDNGPFSLMSPSLMMNLGVVFFVLIIGFFLRLLF